MTPIIRGVQWLPSFKRDLDHLPENIRQEACSAGVGRKVF